MPFDPNYLSPQSLSILTGLLVKAEANRIKSMTHLSKRTRNAMLSKLYAMPEREVLRVTLA